MYICHNKYVFLFLCYLLYKNLSSDVRIQDLENHNRVDINGKELSELATIQLGLPFLLVIHGEDEKMARRMLKKYCA